MNPLKHSLIAAAVGIAGALGLVPAQAQAQPAPAKAAQASAASDLTDAEVRKVDKENRKLTLRHGAIKSLDMPPMTMVFQVSDPAMLDKLQPGDKIRFKAINDAGRLTVTEVQPAK